MDFEINFTFVEIIIGIIIVYLISRYMGFIGFIIGFAVVLYILYWSFVYIVINYLT